MSHAVVLLSAGHNKKEQGAQFGGVTEFSLTKGWVDRIHYYINELYPAIYVKIVPSTTLSKKIQWINAQDADCAIEIHFNSCVDHRISGCETLHYPSRLSRRFAVVVHNAYANRMHNKDRGVKIGKYLMSPSNPILAMLRLTRCRTLILEPEFIAYHSHIHKYREDACKGIAIGIGRYIREIRNVT